MPNRAVVFVSEAVGDLTMARLSQIMADAERFNRTAGVTGVTLFDGQRFLAYMEGPPDGLDVAFSRAAGATSHSSLIEIARGRVGQRRLPYWPMRCIPLSPPELVQLVRADWTSFLQRGGDQVAPATAMEMLGALVEPFAEAA
ncbi:BLUF domain-containing protein [Stenotrophomonas maltophilia]|uniref:BLUF domain-containing protein n=1 Tax=Stenotrophomonas maltophilia TaxID=40324 RepID=A0ABD7CA59_STEMA|nr:BLUF domain-containing protein [Stenotrophomonas maltophilia]QQQ44156.1 BLUF domain-containing protein [Stenotrophomonas maltophilia]